MISWRYGCASESPKYATQSRAIEAPQIKLTIACPEAYSQYSNHIYRQLIDWLSMVLRLRQHNIGYTADGFYRSDDPTNSVKALKEGG